MIELVEEYEKRVLTVMGEYRRVLEPGIHVIPPLVSRTHSIDMRAQTIEVPRQETITRDNAPVIVDAVVYIRVLDPKKTFLEVDDHQQAVSNLAQTVTRAVVGDYELDDALHNRQELNAKIRAEIDDPTDEWGNPTDEWGIRVEAVEVNEIRPTDDVFQSMVEDMVEDTLDEISISDFDVLAEIDDLRANIEKAEADFHDENYEAASDQFNRLVRDIQEFEGFTTSDAATWSHVLDTLEQQCERYRDLANMLRDTGPDQ